MKYYKFEKIQKGDNPIIRITYKNWWGKMITRDVVKTSIDGFWVFMDSGDLTFNFEPINNFHNNNKDVYYVNGTPLYGCFNINE